jgi:hypothetical protein
MPRAAHLAVGLALASTGCFAADFSGNVMNAATPFVLGRATRDLACPSKQIQVYRELGGRYVARGCGRMAAYDTVCEQLQCDVARAGERPAGWRDRPDYSSPEMQR